MGRSAQRRRSGSRALDKILMAKKARKKAKTVGQTAGKTSARRSTGRTGARARKAKPAPRKKAAKLPAAKKKKREPTTVLDYVRFAADRMVKAQVVFAHGTSHPVAEAAFLVGETLGFHPDKIEDAAGQRVASANGMKIRALVEQRIATRKPTAYLLNKAYMRGLSFYVDERTIVPRSFIGEILDDHFGDGLQLREPALVSRVLDLCTGSGCLAILAARTFPNATIDAVDLSAGAIEVATRNVADHGLAKRIRLAQGDLFAPLAGERYDLIISNPPYVDAQGMAGLPAECEHEPRMALEGGVDGIDLVRRILSDVKGYLHEGGGLLCEVGRCRPTLEAAYPRTPFLWLDTEESEGEVFWLEADVL
jgi:ribosomal protein L3 glutamine methyltransferase